MSAVCASGLTQTSPSSVPAYAAVPPPTPIAEIAQVRAPFGAVPVQPVVRSRADRVPTCGSRLRVVVRYTRYEPTKSWFVLFWFSTHGT